MSVQNSAPIVASSEVPPPPASGAHLRISTLGSKHAYTAEPLDLTWDALVEGLSAPLEADVPKGELPMWSLADYRDGRRGTANVLSVAALGFDVDEPPIPDAAALRAALAPYRAHAHTSSSSTTTAPRWRVVVALSRPVTAAEYPIVWRAVEASFPFRVGQQAKDPQRCWFSPRRGVDGSFVAFTATGEPVDVDAVLAAAPDRGEAQGRILSTYASTFAPPTDALAAELLGRAWPVRGRHGAQLALAGVLRSCGFDADRATDFVCHVCRTAGDEDRPKRVATVWGTWARAARGESVATWGTLRAHVPGPVVDAVRAMIDPTAMALARVRAGVPEKPNKPETTTDSGDHAPLPVFPTHVLPVMLRDFVTGLAVSTQVPVDMTAMMAVATCAGAVAGKVDIAIRNDYSEPLNLYVVCVASPGERKTAVVNACVRPLADAERALKAEAAPRIAMARAKRELAESDLKKLRSEYAKLNKHTVDQEHLPNRLGGGWLDLQRRITEQSAALEGLAVPAEPRLLCGDVTDEKLAILMAEQGGRMTCASAEGTLFEVAAGKYLDGGGGNFGALLQGHAGDFIHVDRVGRESLHVENPRLTVALAVQPEVIERIGNNREMRGKGLLARFLYVHPASLVGRREVDPPELREDVRARYIGLVYALARLAPPAAGTSIPRLQLGPEARALHVAFRRQLEPRTGPGGDLHEIADWSNKLAGAIARIAGVLHVVQHGVDVGVPVAGSTMAAAIEIGEYLLAHARRVFNVMAATQVERDVEALVAWIRTRGGRVTRRELLRGPNAARDPRRREPALSEAIDLGRLVAKGEGYRAP